MSDSEGLKPAYQLFCDIVELSDEERSSILAEVEPEIRDEVVELLAADAAVDSMMFTPIKDLPNTRSRKRNSNSVNDTESFRSTRRSGRRPKPTSPSARSESRYELLKSHKKGGLGEVFFAYDRELKRNVALKEIRIRHADNEVHRARFLQEAEITAKLEHPGVPPVYGSGVYSDGRPFYAMKFIDGPRLQEKIDDFHSAENSDRGYRSIGFYELLNHIIDVCNTIEYAHSRGIVHRDIKPENIMLGQFGETLVGDWGLAKVTGRDDIYQNEELSTLTLISREAVGDTQTGKVLGTLAYMSPEQAAGFGADAGTATDVYSLGATLYTVIVGQPAFKGKIDEVLEKIQVGEFRRPQEVDSQVPPQLEAICVKAMSRDPRRRYRSPREVAEEIARYIAGEQVMAIDDTWRTRLARIISRNRATASSILTAVVMLILFAIWKIIGGS